MLKRTRIITIITVILYFILITFHVFAGINDSMGLLSAKGNISVCLFFELQPGGGEDSVLVDVSKMVIFSIIGSGFFIYLKNNNTFSLIQQRIGYSKFLKQGVSRTFLSALALALLTNFYEMLLINWFYFPFVYKTNEQIYLRGIRPGNFSSNDLTEMLLFIILSAIGWGIFAILVFSVGLYVRKNALYVIVGPILGLALILLPILGNMNSIIWRKFSYSWFLFSLVAPGQYTFISQAPPIKSIFAFGIAIVIYLSISIVLIRVWYKQKLRRE